MSSRKFTGLVCFVRDVEQNKLCVYWTCRSYWQTDTQTHISPSHAQLSGKEMPCIFSYVILKRAKEFLGGGKKSFNVGGDSQKALKESRRSRMPRCCMVTAVLCCHPEILCTEQQPDRHRAKIAARDQCHTKASWPNAFLCRHCGSIPRFPSYQQILV